MSRRLNLKESKLTVEAAPRWGKVGQMPHLAFGLPHHWWGKPYQ